MQRPHKYEQGQILLIIVLVMIVALTIGLSVVTRSITNLQVSTEEESSQRALSAAEAGVERAIQTKSDVPSTSFNNNSSIKNANITDISGLELLVNNGNIVVKDDTADIWLSNQTDNTDLSLRYSNRFSGSLQIMWGSASDLCRNGGTNTMAALDIVVISNPASPQIIHYPVDPCSGSNGSRTTANKFCTITAGSPPAGCPVVTQNQQSSVVAGKQFRFAATIPNITEGILARVIPLYAPTVIGVKSAAAVSPQPLPSQGSIIESVGTSGNTERKVSVYRSVQKFPAEFFPYILFSPQ